MAANTDVEFTFNPESFLKGVQKMSDAMNGFEVKTKEKGKQVENTHTSISAGMIAKGQILASMFMKVAGSVVNFVKSGVPEIGKTFDIAGDIFKRNLFWPLRKELAPMLQKILDWTRDHRAMFVRWGGALVNVFRAVTTVFKGFYKMFEAMIKPIADKLKSIFGGVAGGISEVFNIVLFKITAVVMFLQVAFMPLFERIGKAIAFAIGLVNSFFQGFSNGISGISKPFGDVIQQFLRLIDLFKLGNNEVNILNGAFKVMGDFVGTSLYTALSALAQVIDTIVFGITKMVQGVTWAKAKISGSAEDVAKINAEMEKTNKEFEERTKQRSEDVNKKWSGMWDRTKATFSPSSVTSSKQVNASQKVNIEKMEIKVSEGQDAKKAGSDFIEGMNKKMSQQFKGLIMNEMTAQGNI